MPAQQTQTDRAETIARLARQFYEDLEADARTFSEENLNAWLWFTCPAEYRADVGPAILARRDLER